MSRGEIINVVALVSTPGGEGTKYVGDWVKTATAAEVAQCYEGWDPKLLAVLNVSGININIEDFD